MLPAKIIKKVYNDQKRAAKKLAEELEDIFDHGLPLANSALEDAISYLKYYSELEESGKINKQ